MEMEVDNLKMDMSGVELSVANAHLQIQRVEDEVVATLDKKVSDMYQEFFTSGGAMESRFDGTLEEHHDRLNAVELGNARAAEKCDSVREVLTSWMVTFEALEGNIGKTAEDVKVIEDWLEPNSRSIIEAQVEIEKLTDLVKDQASVIRLLQDRVGELELGHGVLRAHVINIEVGR
jgi:predicted  nucleic acid-binding Zn-ribbon protein